MSVLQDLLRAGAELLAAVEERSAAIHGEADLRTTLELLPEWAAFVRLASDCTDGLPQTIPEERFSIFRKVVTTGGQNRFHLAGVARALGYDVEVEDIEEPHAFIAEVSGAEDLASDDAWAFVAIVHAPEVTPQFARCGESVCGEALVTFGNELLECTLDAIKPAHTLLLYVYDRPYVGYAPWSLEVPAPVALPLVLPIPTRL